MPLFVQGPNHSSAIAGYHQAGNGGGYQDQANHEGNRKLRRIIGHATDNCQPQEGNANTGRQEKAGHMKSKQMPGTRIKILRFSR
jgi:hypothetical protein